MSQEIEIEYKNMVTADEFQRLCTYFSVTTFIEQTNDYFETEDFALKQAKSALRIRHKQHTYTLTLKQPAAVGLLETHQTLTSIEAQRMMETGLVPNGVVAQQLHHLQIPRQLHHFGCLKTNRAEIQYKQGLLVFDHSFYFEHNDYELEYEVRDAKQKKDFLDLLITQEIPIRPAQNKVQRFFLAKQNKAL